MHQKANFTYLKWKIHNNCEVMELPFKNETFSMYILLSNNSDNIDQFYNSICSNEISELIDQIKRTQKTQLEVNV